MEQPVADHLRRLQELVDDIGNSAEATADDEGTRLGHGMNAVLGTVGMDPDVIAEHSIKRARTHAGLVMSGIAAGESLSQAVYAALVTAHLDGFCLGSTWAKAEPEAD